MWLVDRCRRIMALYTKDIVLEEVTASTFNQMKEYWNLAKFNTREDSVQARISNPLTGSYQEDSKVDDYGKFLAYLLTHPFIDQICVSTGPGTWLKKYARKITPAIAAQLATLAAHNQKERNYFNILFKEKEVWQDIQRASIEFREHTFGPHDTRIVGYQTTVPQRYIHLFSPSLQKKSFFVIQGLWVPEDIKL